MSGLGALRGASARLDDGAACEYQSGLMEYDTKLSELLDPVWEKETLWPESRQSRHVFWEGRRL